MVKEREARPRDGLCQWGHYYVDVERKRTVVETYSVTVYQLLPHEVAAHFIQLVGAAVRPPGVAHGGLWGGGLAGQLVRPLGVAQGISLMGGQQGGEAKAAGLLPAANLALFSFGSPPRPGCCLPAWLAPLPLCWR